VTDERQPVPDWADMIDEQAAEITRLRAEVASDNHAMVKYLVQIDEQAAEITRLRAEVERLRSASQPIIRVIEDRRAHGGKYVDKPASVIMLEAKLLLDLEAALTPSQEPRT